MARPVYISKDSTRASVLEDISRQWDFDSVTSLGIGDDFYLNASRKESFLEYVRRHIPFEYFDDPKNVFVVSGHRLGRPKHESIMLFQDMAYGGSFLVRIGDREAFLAAPPSPFFDPELEDRPFSGDGRPPIQEQRLSVWRDLARRQDELKKREAQLEAVRTRISDQKEFADGIASEFYRAGHTTGFFKGVFSENPTIVPEETQRILAHNDETTDQLAAAAMEAVGDAEEDAAELELELEQEKAELMRTREQLDVARQGLVASNRQIDTLRRELANCEELKDAYSIEASLAMPLGRKRLNGGWI
jgi:hypothetical protein